MARGTRFECGTSTDRQSTRACNSTGRRKEYTRTKFRSPHAAPSAQRAGRTASGVRRELWHAAGWDRGGREGWPCLFANEQRPVRTFEAPRAPQRDLPAGRSNRHRKTSRKPNGLRIESCSTTMFSRRKPFGYRHVDNCGARTALAGTGQEDAAHLGQLGCGSQANRSGSTMSGSFIRPGSRGN